MPEAEGRGRGRQELSVLRMPQKKAQEPGDEVEPKNHRIMNEFIEPGESHSGGRESN